MTVAIAVTTLTHTTSSICTYVVYFTSSAKRTKYHIKLIGHAHDVTQTNNTKTPETTNERKS